MEAKNAVTKLRTVLRALGGKATHTELKEEFKKRFNTDFDKWWRESFDEKRLKNVVEQPLFKNTFTVNPATNGQLLFQFRSDKSLQPEEEAAATVSTEVSEPPAPSPTNDDSSATMESAVAKLKEVLEANGGKATHGELTTKFKNEFKKDFDRWWRQSFRKHRLRGVVELPVFKDAIVSKQIKDGQYEFRLRTDTPGAEQSFPKVPRAETSIGRQSPARLHLGVEVLKDVLTACGGAATHHQLVKEYRKRFDISFDTWWMDIFKDSMKNVVELPLFKETITAVNVSRRNREFRLRSMEGPPEQKNPSRPRQMPSASRKPADNSMTCPATPESAVAQLKEVLRTCGGEATQKKLVEEFRSRFDVGFGPLLKRSFGRRGIIGNPIFAASIDATKVVDGERIFRLRPVPKKDAQRTRRPAMEPTTKPQPLPSVSQKLEAESSEARKPNASRLRQVLTACGGSATHAKLNKEFFERFGMDFDRWRVAEFDEKKLNKFLELPKIKSMITVIRHGKDGHVTFQLLTPVNEPKKTSKKSNPAVVKKTKMEPKTPTKVSLSGLSKLKTALLECNGEATESVLSGTFEKLYKVPFNEEWRRKHLCTGHIGSLKLVPAVDVKIFAFESDGGWSLRLRKISVPDPDEKELAGRGVALIKNILRSSGGSLTQPELGDKLRSRYRLQFHLVSEGFFKERRLRFLNEVPEFKAEMTVTKGIDDIWTFKLRNKDEEMSTFTPEEAARAVKASSRPDLFKKEDAVSKIKEVVQSCGGYATFNQLNSAFKRLFQVDFDQEWRKKNFGVEKIIELSKMPVFNYTIMISQTHSGQWLFRLREIPSLLSLSFPSPSSATHSPTELAHAVDEQVDQVVQMLIDMGGMVPLSSLKTAMKKRHGDGFHLEKFFSVEKLRDLRGTGDFDRQIGVHEATRDPMCKLRLPEHWKKVEDSALAVLYFCDGRCPIDRFVQLYHRLFNVETKIQDHLETVIFQLPLQTIKVTILDSEVNGVLKETRFLEGPAWPMFEGRKRVFAALKMAGGRALVQELKHAYKDLFKTSIYTDWEIYFGTKNDERVLNLMCNDRMFMLETERGKELFIKPEFNGYDIPMKMKGGEGDSEEEIFSAQCSYVADRVEAALQKLAGKAIPKEEFGFVLNDDSQFARFVESCPSALFRYMIRSKATLVEHVISLKPKSLSSNSSMPSSQLEQLKDSTDDECYVDCEPDDGWDDESVLLADF